MKTMKIAVSRELVSKVSTHREKVMLDNTDFTDVAAVVITVVESYSGILALLKRTGFQLPVFMFSTEPERCQRVSRRSSRVKHRNCWNWNLPPAGMKRTCCHPF